MSKLTKLPIVALIAATAASTMMLAVQVRAETRMSFNGGAEIHYAPAENLERIDVALIDSARHEIDMAAYILTDWAVIHALTRAADRGIKVRIYLDPTQLAYDEVQPPFKDLADTPGVEMRLKNGESYMHLKAFEVDGKVLRSGAANFSASGLKQQDNDLIVINSPEAAGAFERDFEAMFALGVTYVVGVTP
jgi:phosphatidylserine/phosphatidylglycerophosphate/cardiolipin synthase-like enzyme